MEKDHESYPDEIQQVYDDLVDSTTDLLIDNYKHLIEVIDNKVYLRDHMNRCWLVNIQLTRQETNQKPVEDPSKTPPMAGDKKTLPIPIPVRRKLQF